MTDAKFPEGRKLLALYPVILFYLSLAWVVLIGFQQGPARSAAVTEAITPATNGTTTATATGTTRILAQALTKHAENALNLRSIQ